MSEQQWQYWFRLGLCGSALFEYRSSTWAHFNVTFQSGLEIAVSCIFVVYQCLKTVLAENVSMVFYKRRKKVDILSAFEVGYVGVALVVLLNILELCANKTMELKLFSSMPTGHWVCHDDLIEKLSVDAASGSPSHHAPATCLIRSQTFSPSFETGQEFLGLVTAVGVKRKALRQVFLTVYKKWEGLETFSVCKD